jgi:hypothetical protein
MRTDDLIARAMVMFPGSREPRPGYCDVCGAAIGRHSDSLGAMLCDDCWQPRFYAPRLPKARRALSEPADSEPSLDEAA